MGNLKSIAMKPAQEVSLDFKIGQMLMLGFRGYEVTPDSKIAHDITDRYIGGVVLSDWDVGLNRYERNIRSPQQLRALTSQLQSLSTAPLLIAIGEEGGRVDRLKQEYGFPPTRSAEYLGERNSPALTHRHARLISMTLRDHGINLNLAPVVDLNVNSDSPVIGRVGRSFSRDADVVISQATAFIAAHHELGVLTAIKHFPGHGSAVGDSHRDFTDVTHTWVSEELEPYRRLISEGLVDVVMTAHVANNAFDERYPATLSSILIGEVLREEMQYDGVVISDDMQMGAITAMYGFETAIEQTINAGVDIILIANNMVYDEDIGSKAVAVIKKLIAEGRISTRRIDESYERIRRLKEKIGVPRRYGQYSFTSRHC